MTNSSKKRHQLPQPDVNVLVMTRGDERYVFAWREQHTIDLCRTLGRYAADPQLSFTWYDAARLNQQIREFTKG